MIYVVDQKKAETEKKQEQCGRRGDIAFFWGGGGAAKYFETVSDSLVTKRINLTRCSIRLQERVINCEGKATIRSRYTRCIICEATVGHHLSNLSFNCGFPLIVCSRHRYRFFFFGRAYYWTGDCVSCLGRRKICAEPLLIYGHGGADACSPQWGGIRKLGRRRHSPALTSVSWFGYRHSPQIIVD